MSVEDFDDGGSSLIDMAGNIRKSNKSSSSSMSSRHEQEAASKSSSSSRSSRQEQEAARQERLALRGSEELEAKLRAKRPDYLRGSSHDTDKKAKERGSRSSSSSVRPGAETVGAASSVRRSHRTRNAHYHDSDRKAKEKGARRKDSSTPVKPGAESVRSEGHHKRGKQDNHRTRNAHYHDSDRKSKEKGVRRKDSSTPVRPGAENIGSDRHHRRAKYENKMRREEDRRGGIHQNEIAIDENEGSSQAPRSSYSSRNTGVVAEVQAKIVDDDEEKKQNQMEEIEKRIQRQIEDIRQAQQEQAEMPSVQVAVAKDKREGEDTPVRWYCKPIRKLDRMSLCKFMVLAVVVIIAFGAMRAFGVFGDEDATSEPAPTDPPADESGQGTRRHLRSLSSDFFLSKKSYYVSLLNG